MQILQPGVRATLEAIHTELSRKTDAPTASESSTPPAAEMMGDCSIERHLVETESAIPDNSPHQLAAIAVKPQDGVILEFATKMRQTRGEEVPIHLPDSMADRYFGEPQPQSAR